VTNNEIGTIELNYYWGDDEFHSSVRLPLLKSANLTALALQSKPEHVSLGYVLVYVDGLYHSAIELI